MPFPILCNIVEDVDCNLLYFAEKWLLLLASLHCYVFYNRKMNFLNRCLYRVATMTF